MTTQRGADRSCRDPHAEPEQLALDTLVAPAWVLPGQADDQLLEFPGRVKSPRFRGAGRSRRRRPAAGASPAASGLTKKHDHRARGKARLMRRAQRGRQTRHRSCKASFDSTQRASEAVSGDAILPRHTVRTASSQAQPSLRTPRALMPLLGGIRATTNHRRPRGQFSAVVDTWALRRSIKVGFIAVRSGGRQRRNVGGSAPTSRA